MYKVGFAIPLRRYLFLAAHLITSVPWVLLLFFRRGALKALLDSRVNASYSATKSFGWSLLFSSPLTSSAIALLWVLATVALSYIFVVSNYGHSLRGIIRESVQRFFPKYYPADSFQRQWAFQEGRKRFLSGLSFLISVVLGLILGRDFPILFQLICGSLLVIFGVFTLYVSIRRVREILVGLVGQESVSGLQWGDLRHYCLAAMYASLAAIGYMAAGSLLILQGGFLPQSAEIITWTYQMMCISFLLFFGSSSLIVLLKQF